MDTDPEKGELIVSWNKMEFTTVCLLSAICHRFIVGKCQETSHQCLKNSEIDQLGGGWQRCVWSNQFICKFLLKSDDLQLINDRSGSKDP